MKKITMNNLKLVRKDRNFTQVKLSFLGKVSQSSIVAYENGTKLPSLETLVTLAESLHTSLDYLVDRTSNPIPIDKLDKMENKDIQTFIQYFSELSANNKANVLSYIKGLLDSEKTI